MALFVTPGTNYTAHASDTKTLTPAETRALIGDTLSAQYYDGTAMQDCTFAYGGTTTIGTMLVDGSPSLTFVQGDSVIWYSAQINPSVNPQYITVDVRPQYSFFDTDVIQQMCGLSCGTVPGVSAYSPPSWRWRTSFGGDTIIENQLTANSAYYAIFNATINATAQHFTFVDVDMTQQATFSAYSNRALFYGNGATSGTMYFVLTCPTVADASTMASGTDIGTTSSGDITVNIDMTETNSILDSILDAIEGVVDAIAGLFVPSEDALTDFKDDMQDLLAEHLGGLYDAEQAVEDYAQTIADADTTATQTIRFPALAIPLGVATFSLGPYDIPLKPYAQDFSILWDALALAIDIIVTTAFINMCRKKLEIFLHPDGEVIVS